MTTYINKQTAATIRHRRVQSFYVVTMNENGMIKTPYRSTSERQSGIFINIVNFQTNVPIWTAISSQWRLFLYTVSGLDLLW